MGCVVLDLCLFLCRLACLLGFACLVFVCLGVWVCWLFWCSCYICDLCLLTWSFVVACFEVVYLVALFVFAVRICLQLFCEIWCVWV